MNTFDLLYTYINRYIDINIIYNIRLARYIEAEIAR